MKRMSVDARKNWQAKVEEAGLIFHTCGDSEQGQCYWNETACYLFSSRQVDVLEEATNQLHQMCLKAGQHIIDQNRFPEMNIPAKAVPAIKKAWDEEPPAIYGRFDLAYDGTNPPKLLEYNADTPTSLLEAGVVQWYWLQDCYPKSDQFNSIHERLIAKWQELKAYVTSPLYFAAFDDLEELMTAGYMQDTADQAGIETRRILMPEIGWDANRRCFVDLEEKPMRSIFKLYPWEMMLQDQFSDPALEASGGVQWIEPIWKMMFSNKAILAILWELFPNHPNLLEAHLGSARWMSTYARKPLWGREGANIALTTDSGEVSRGGAYGKEGYVYQALAALPDFDGVYPVLGSWVIDGEAAGIGIRESATMITDNRSRFVPHRFE
jgi:glutathionylspermidine synthase